MGLKNPGSSTIVTSVGTVAAETVTDAVWDQLTTGHTTVASFGQLVSRVHVVDPRQWSFCAGTNFFLGGGTTTALITSGTAGQVLSEFGWTTTALAYVAGSAADFASSADPGIAPHFLLADASDLLASPAIFGSYNHMLQAQRILGYLPTSLNCEVWAAFTTASADEPSTAFGFVEDGGSVITAAAADQLACISSNATNFELNSGAASDAGAAVDNAWHLWKISVTSTQVEWFIDGTSQGTIALEADEFPVSFEAGVVAAGTNDIALGNVHIWYE